jgi:hypothetical protein
MYFQQYVPPTVRRTVTNRLCFLSQWTGITLRNSEVPFLRLPRLNAPCYIKRVGSRDSVVGIATRYGLEGPEIESRWGEIFRTYPDRFRGPPSLLYNGYWFFSWGKGGRGVILTTHPLLVSRLRKSWAISPLTLWVLLGLLGGSLYPYKTSIRHKIRISPLLHFQKL